MTPEERASDKVEGLDGGKTSGCFLLPKSDYAKAMADAIRAAVQEEREACAKIAEERFGPPGGIYGEDGEAGALIAKAIRARKDGG